MAYNITDVDQSRNEAYLKQIARKLGAEVGHIMYDTNLPPQSREEAYLKAILDKIDYTPEGTTIGDMLQDIYDPHGDVKALGGIDQYVLDQKRALERDLGNVIDKVDEKQTQALESAVSDLAPLQVKLTPGDIEGTYTADAGYGDLISAYQRGVDISVLVQDTTNAILPLMVAEIADNNASFVFGYLDLQMIGGAFIKRSIHFSHIVASGTAIDIWEDHDISAEYLNINGGSLNGDLDLAGHTIYNVQELQTTGANKLYLGRVIHGASATGARLTATDDGEGACMSPNNSIEYRPFCVGTPSSDVHAVPRKTMVDYVSANTAGRSYVTIAVGASSVLDLADGVYLMACCTTKHRGLGIAYICGGVYTRTIEELVGWSIIGTGENNKVSVKNNSTVELKLYITAIGAGA